MKQLCAILLTVLVFGAVLADAVRRQERRDTRLDRRDTRRETRRTEMRRDMRRDMRRETRRDTRRDERRDERRRLSFKLGEDSGLEILVKDVTPENSVGASAFGAGLGLNSGRFEL
eukprot:XP_011668518.1 PREDICTED: uncharacterized protein ZK643.5-like [Strongylocentrotus purpuratus]